MADYQDLVDRLLEIDKTAVVMSGLVSREPRSRRKPGDRIDMSMATTLIQKLAKKYVKQGKKVRFLAIHKLILVPGSGKAGQPYIVEEGALDGDGVHMSKPTVQKVVNLLLSTIRNLPTVWF